MVLGSGGSQSVVSPVEKRRDAFPSETEPFWR